MSITLGSYSTLPNTLADGGCKRTDVEKATRQVMADGSLIKRFISGRWRWHLSWDVNATNFGNLDAAYVAARATGKTFKPPDTATTWTVVASGWQETPYTSAGGATRYKVEFDVEETTA